MSTADMIRDCCDNLKEFLLEKNARYGDSAIHPAKVFSKMDACDSILIRLDDKINRVINNPQPLPRKNDMVDIMGYIVLYLISRNEIDFVDLID